MSAKSSRKASRKTSGKLQMIAEASAQNHKHLSTPDLQSRMQMLDVAVINHDAEILRLQRALTDIKARRALDAATLVGVEAVLASRG